MRLSFQGFLYVFGGLLDSAYSNSRYPLWLFDIGELPRGAVWLAAGGEACTSTPTCERVPARMFTEIP